MDNCYNGTTVPELEEENCGGLYQDDKCVIHEIAIPYLNLPSNSSIYTIINAFILNQMHQDELIANLTNQIQNG